MLESIFLLIVLWILGTIFLPILSAHLVFRHLKSCLTVMSLCLTMLYIINFLLFVIWIQTHLVPVFFSFLWTVRMYASVVCATCASCCSSLYNKRHPTGQHAVHQSKRPHCTTRCDVRGPHPAHADLFVTRCPSRNGMNYSGQSSQHDKLTKFVTEQLLQDYCLTRHINYSVLWFCWLGNGMGVRSAKSCSFSNP